MLVPPFAWGDTTIKCSATTSCGYPHSFRKDHFYITFYITMNDARNKGLVWNTHLHSFLLNTYKIMVIQTNRYSLVFLRVLFAAVFIDSISFFDGEESFIVPFSNASRIPFSSLSYFILTLLFFFIHLCCFPAGNYCF